MVTQNDNSGNALSVGESVTWVWSMTNSKTSSKTAVLTAVSVRLWNIGCGKTRFTE
jgi:hypothetical protein